MAANWKRNYVLYQKQFLSLLMLYRERNDIQAYVEILLSIATVAVFFVFAIRPTAKTIAELIQENKGKEETIAIMDQKIQNLTAAADLMERDRDQIALLHSAIPDKAEPNHYVQQLEALSQQNNLALVGVNIGPAKILGDTTTTDTAPSQNASVSLGTVPGGAKGVAASIDVSGEFSSLSNFFSQVQSMRRPMFLDSFLFSTEGSKKDPTQKPVIIFTILGQAPYYNNGK